MDKRRTADIRKEACGEMSRKDRMAAENGDRTVIGQIHWKGRLKMGTEQSLDKSIGKDAPTPSGKLMPATARSGYQWKACGMN